MSKKLYLQYFKYSPCCGEKSIKSLFKNRPNKITSYGWDTFKRVTYSCPKCYVHFGERIFYNKQNLNVQRFFLKNYHIVDNFLHPIRYYDGRNKDKKSFECKNFVEAIKLHEKINKNLIFE